MKQGTSLGSQLGRWIILAAMVALLGALLFTTRPAGAQDNGTIEFPENSDDPVITFSAGDPEDDTPISWSMPTTAPSPLPTGFVDADFTANDAADFDISPAGVLRFDVNGDADVPDVKAPPDFENPVDSDTDNTYMVVVQASDPEALGPENTYHKVVVEVTNVDEDGKVTWTIDHTPDTDPVDTEVDTPTLLQFQPGDIVWATVEDGDISGPTKTVNNAIWRWYRSSTKSLTGGTLIEGATTRNYTVQDRTGSDDVGMYLRAEASYTDGSGPVVTASRVSDYPIQAYRTNNETPTFGADTSTARSVNEGMKGMTVGAPVTATDANGDVLNYTISTNVQINTQDVFKIDQKTGQITTEVTLDFDTAQDTDQAGDFTGVTGGAAGDNIYLVRVRATDSSGTATDNVAANTVPDDMTVIITLKNVNEKPAFGSIDAAATPNANVLSQTIAENATGDSLQVANYTASDTDANDTVLISLRGEDMGMFQLADDSDNTESAAHILSFRTSPNYEDPKDRDGDNVYKVTVRASDRGNLYVEKFLTVRVTNVDEAPSIMNGTPTSYTFVENGKEAVATFSATDPEGANITWSVPATAPGTLPSGIVAGDFADQEDFDISATGVLTFDVGGDADDDDTPSVSPDYENAGDTDADNTYNVVVAAADSGATDVQTGYHKVTVMVTEVREDGKVTWTVDHNADNTADTPTLVQFQDGAILVASVTDGDASGADKDLSAGADWQWYKSSSSSSCGTDALSSANGAQSTTYTVQADDRGNYLCAKATYTIGGISYSAYKVSDYKVGRDLSTNNANPTFGPDTSTTRMVYEGKKGMMVGDPVIATDADSAASLGDQLNYTLVTSPTVTVGTATLNVFEIDQETGQITTNVDLDYDPPITDPTATPTRSYTVTVRATDSAGAATDDGTATNTVPNDMEVTISLKNVNEKPTFTLPTAANLRTAIDVPEGNTVLWSADAATNAFSAGSADNVTYAATDLDDGDTAILVLDGPDKDLFQLSATGTAGNFLLSFTDAGKPDYENPMDDGGDNRYNVTVRATDGTLNADRMIAVNITDENEGPDLTRGGVAISGPSSTEYAEGGMDAVATYTARGSEADSAVWSLEGDDAGAFDISGGELSFSASPDFENPTDVGADNVYNVTVVATAGEHMDTHDVAVTVTNMNEDGAVTLMPETPVAGNAVTAELSDPDAPDGVMGTVSWQWSSSADGMAGTFTDIDGADAASYTPDAPMYLMAMATYEDVHGSQSATSDPIGVMDLMVSGMAAVNYAENGTGDVAEYGTNASSSAAWTLSGDDMDDLSISNSGVLTFNASPDYEAPTDADTNNVYMVTVMAAVGNATATMDVAVTVTDVAESVVEEYDTDGTPGIQIDELFNAIDVYFAGGELSLDELFEIIDAYFTG